MAIQYDIHMHSSFSTDSDAPMETMVRGAMEKGLAGVCFTEHLDLDSIGQVYLMAELSCDDKAFSSDLYFYLGQDDLWHAGPVWRSGAGFGYGRYTDPEKAWFRDAYLIEALMADPAFRQSMQSYYRTTFLPAANRLAGKGGLSESYSKKIRYTGLMNEIVWPSPPRL